ncbi:hypothetical protein C7447_10298 [Tenacibaculum adriaticum]|uniref:Uncharacterized protein n=1 Tax=Tenacibaculum adriaticum TaxID=413713 RepID=A0A5S5DS83_9FLAO|nr:hypothetical protein [Tenacibaculum adriaticum]TYP98783.1 hypothetical protein C7447_10298 [Tenacibaculum adriaticum]
MKIKFFIIFLFTTIFSQNNFNEVGDGENLGSWKIQNGILIENEAEKTDLALYNWNIFYSIFPKRLTQKYIKRLVLISDGVDEKTGALGALNKTNTEWQLVLDPADVDFTSKNRERVHQSIYTLVHEFGHLLTLNNTQIIPTTKKEVDMNEPYLTIEGQALKDSYINMFVIRFWNGSLLKEWDHIQKKYCFTEQKSCIEKLYGLYQENYTDFLTDYAAESPEEDIVESWTAFVFRDKVDDPQTVAEQKMNFFYQFPELVNYRKIIRKNILKYLN